MQKQLADLMREYHSGFVNSQIDLKKVKTAKLIGDNFIFIEMENGNSRIFRLEDNKVSIYGAREVLHPDFLHIFKSIFRDARISSLIEEEI
jgi:hypothetical protein